MSKITITTNSLGTVARKLESFRLSIPGRVADEVVKQIVEFAASGKAPNGSDWKPYTPGYAAKRRKMGLSTRPVNKRVTGALLASVKNRDGLVGPSEGQLAKAKGLEKKRVSFQVSPVTPGNVERMLLKEFNNATA